MKALKILGWIFVPYVMIFVSWKGLRAVGRTFGIVWAVIAVFAVIGNMTSEEAAPTAAPEQKADTSNAVTEDTSKKKEEDSQAKAAEEEAKKAAKEKAEAEAKEAAKASVQEFEKKVYALEAEIKPIMDNYQKAMSGLGEGKVNINTAYEATVNAKKATSALQSNISKLPIPDNLDKEVKNLLASSKSEISTAYYSKGKAFDAVLKYLDNQKLSDMQTFKDETKMSDQFMLSGVAKIFEAKTKVGIDITAEAK